jgi:hypothetical protein
MKKSYEKPKILTDEISVSVLMAPGPSTNFIKCSNPPTCGGFTAAFTNSCKGCTSGSWCKVEKGLKPTVANQDQI